MDFHTLSRRELQALCKKNKIPANMTNLAMADALASLQKVEGLEELLNPPEVDSELLMGTPSIVARTATRMSTRRKPTKEQQVPVEDFEGRSLLGTPAAPATRRKVQAASARQKVETVVGDSNVPEDSVMEPREKRPPVQMVYSTRRSVRLLEKTMADLTLGDKKTMDPIKMDDLDSETTEKKEVPEEVKEIKYAEEISRQNDPHAPADQKQNNVPKYDMETEDGVEEYIETDNFSQVSAGVELALSGSDEKDDDHEKNREECNIIETPIDLVDDNVLAKMGDFPIIEVHSENIPSTSPVEDSEGVELFQEGEHEAISENVPEVPPLPEDQMDDSQDLVDHFAEKELVNMDHLMDPGLTETLDSASDAPVNVALIETEIFSTTDAEPTLRVMTPAKIELCADSVASNDGFIMPQVEYAGETDGLPRSVSTKAPTSNNRWSAFSPLMAGELSSQKLLTQKKMGNILDENKENVDNIIIPRAKEPNADKIKASLEEASMLTPLNDKSLRQLTKMLKEKLQIANKKSDEVSVQQQQQPGKMRQALQALPDNCMSMGTTGQGRND